MLEQQKMLGGQTGSQQMSFFWQTEGGEEEVKQHYRGMSNTSNCAGFPVETWAAGLGVVWLDCDCREKETEVKYVQGTQETTQQHVDFTTAIFLENKTFQKTYFWIKLKS